MEIMVSLLQTGASSVKSPLAEEPHFFLGIRNSVKLGQKDIRILLVEDEKNLSRSLKKLLERRGYIVGVAFDGAEGQQKVMEEEFQLVILDVMLPDKSGFELLRELRSKEIRTPVLILTALDRPEDRIKGLNIGADDYLLKPFDSGELVARVEAILRRTGSERTSILQAADLLMDISRRSVRRGGKEIRLTEKEFSLLEFFLRNKNEVITRKRLIEQVWGYSFNPGTNIVDVYVSYLREAIDDGFVKKLIKTVHGEGFILIDD
jgi:DNA-binding response OmpR family regulator